MDREKIKENVADITIALETANATLNMIMATHEDEPISWVLYGVKNQLASIEEANDRILDISERAVSAWRDI